MISYRFAPISSQNGVLFLRHPVEGLKIEECFIRSLSAFGPHSLSVFKFNVTVLLECK